MPTFNVIVEATIFYSQSGAKTPLGSVFKVLVEQAESAQEAGSKLKRMIGADFSLTETRATNRMAVFTSTSCVLNCELGCNSGTPTWADVEKFFAGLRGY